MEKHLRWKHALSIAFLLLCFGGVVGELGWISGHLDRAKEAADLDNAPIPPAVIMIFFVGRLTFGLVALVLCYFLSRGNNQARQWTLRILPILFLITAFEFFASFNRETGGSSVVLGIAIAPIIMAIPYWLIYRFYSTSKVISSIFTVPVSVTLLEEAKTTTDHTK